MILVFVIEFRCECVHPVVFQYSVERSCRFSIVMIEEPAEPFVSDDPTWLSSWNALDQPIAQSLMRPLVVIVVHVPRDRSPEVPVTIQFLEHSYLLLQELDLVSLFLVEPSGDGEQHYFDGRCQHRASLRGFQIRLRWMRSG